MSSPEHLALKLNQVISSSADERRRLIIYNCANVRRDREGYERKMYEIAASMKNIEGVEIKDFGNSVYRIALDKTLIAYEAYMAEGFGDESEDMLWYMAVQRRAMDAAAVSEALCIADDMKYNLSIGSEPMNAVIITSSDYIKSPDMLHYIARREKLDKLLNVEYCSLPKDAKERASLSKITDVDLHMKELETYLIRYDFMRTWAELKQELLRAGALTGSYNKDVDMEKADVNNNKKLLRSLSGTYYTLDKYIHKKAARHFNSLLDEEGMGYEHIIYYPEMAKVVDDWRHMPKSFMYDA